MSLLLRLATVLPAVTPTVLETSLKVNDIPQLANERLQITLYAAAPDIVTLFEGTVGPECHSPSLQWQY